MTSHFGPLEQLDEFSRSFEEAPMTLDCTYLIFTVRWMVGHVQVVPIVFFFGSILAT